MNKYPILFKDNGPLISSKGFSEQDKQDTEIHYHHREKAECALVASSSWYGGDVHEYGAYDMNTARNILTSIHLSGMAKAYKDTKFYFFDMYGKLTSCPDQQTEWNCDLKTYFKPYSDQGDQIKRHEAYLDDHGLFRSKCHLIQGMFHETCTPEFKASYGDRKIGYCSIDCNVAWSYKTVFEFVFNLMGENSYIYLDEGLQSPDVLAQWEQFQEALFVKRNMKTAYIRNAGGFGSLWRLYPIVKGTLEL